MLVAGGCGSARVAPVTADDDTCRVEQLAGPADSRLSNERCRPSQERGGRHGSFGEGPSSIPFKPAHRWSGVHQGLRTSTGPTRATTAAAESASADPTWPRTTDSAPERHCCLTR